MVCIEETFSIGVDWTKSTTKSLCAKMKIGGGGRSFFPPYSQFPAIFATISFFPPKVLPPLYSLPAKSNTIPSPT